MRFFLLLLIVFLAAFLRFYQLPQIPNSLSGDEVAFGYNAYSILQTGRDEYGIKYPLLFQSFNDHKNPVFVYMLVPFVKLFGLNEWAIRLPSAIFGVLLIPLFYLLTQKLTSNKKLSLLSAFLAAICPWLIQYSRIALEVNTALFFSLLTVWLFLEAEKKPVFYLLSFVNASLAFWTYYGSKLWLLLFLPFLVMRVLINKKTNKYFWLGLIIFGLAILPQIKLYFSGNALARQYGISVFADAEERNKDSRVLMRELEDGNQLAKIFHNRRLTFINQAAEGYFNILNPVWLFGQSGGSQIPGTRLLYLWQLALIVLGLVSLISFKGLTWLIFFWLFTGFIPGAITNLPVFDRRILIVSFPLLLLTALGINKLLNDFKNSQLIKKTTFLMLSLTILLSLSFYLHYYFSHGPVAVIDLWGNGMKELTGEVEKEKAKFDKVIVSTELDRPLTYFLFYTQYSPEKYLAGGGTIGGDFREERNHFANYEFKKINWEEFSENNLYVWIGKSYPLCMGIKKTIYQTNGQPLAYIGAFDSTLKGCGY